MSEERLKEIKDSIDFQEMVINNDKELQKARILFDEEKELYDEVIRLNNIINELEKDIKEALNELQPNELVNGKGVLQNVLNDLQELKENK